MSGFPAARMVAPVALHGLLNIGGTLGTAASHGCVRLGNTAISWLAAHTGPGVPVTGNQLAPQAQGTES